jgi:hypothetical protein
MARSAAARGGLGPDFFKDKSWGFCLLPRCELVGGHRAHRGGRIVEQAAGVP